MATEILKTVKPSGGDYTSLAQALTANAQDLVANDSYLVIQIGGDWSGGADTSYVEINGYNTDYDHPIYITVLPEARHNGVWDNSKYRLMVSNDSGGAFRNNSAKNLYVDGLLVANTYDSNQYDGSSGIDQLVEANQGVSFIVFDSCIVYAPQWGFFSLYENNVLLSNSVFISFGADGHSFGSALKTFGQILCGNCIFVNSNPEATGPAIFSGFYSALLGNCYAYTAGSGSAYGSNLTLTTCASNDTSASPGLQSISYSTTAGAFFTDITPFQEDFRIKPGTALDGVGTDLSSYDITTDIIGEARTVPWDIGVFAFEASSSSSSCRSSSSSSSCRSSSSSCRSSSSSSCRSSSSSSCRSSSSSSSSCRSSSSCSSSSSSCRSSSSSSRSNSSSSSSSSSRSSSSSSRSSSSSSSSCRSSSSCSSSSSRSSSSSSCRSSSSCSSSSSRSSSSSSSSSRSSSSSSSSAYLGAQKNYSRQDVSGLPTTDANLSNIFTGGEYVQVQFVDGVRVAQPSVNTHACFLFKDRYASDLPFVVTWVGRSNKACTLAPIVLQIYNRNTSTWETLDQNTTAGANTDITLSGSKISTIANYYDANHEIACRVYQAAT